MRVRFQADADLDARIIRGLKRKQPEVDFQTAEEAGLPGLANPDVLRMVADSGRILVTHDRRTMPGHFARFAAGRVIHRRPARSCCHSKVVAGTPRS